jgi:peptide-methionine (S)-S-oxide reductase
MKFYWTSLVFLLLAACGNDPATAGEPQTLPTQDTGLEKATFAGGCFWCMEAPFDRLDGVVSTTSGYSGGPEKNPTYRQVSSGSTGHTEVIQVLFDPKKVSYEKLLQVYWHNIDPTVKNRQFCDRGAQYRTAIFPHNTQQRKAAEASKIALQKAGTLAAPIQTPIVTFTAFYRAEEYHQNFYLKNPGHYRSYRLGCGRDARLKELWGSAGGH